MLEKSYLTKSATTYVFFHLYTGQKWNREKELHAKDLVGLPIQRGKWYLHIIGILFRRIEIMDIGKYIQKFDPKLYFFSVFLHCKWLNFFLFIVSTRMLLYFTWPTSTMIRNDEPSLKEFFPVCFKENYFAYCLSRTEICSYVLTPRICENKCQEIIFKRITGLLF